MLRIHTADTLAESIMDVAPEVSKFTKHKLKLPIFYDFRILSLDL